MWWVYAKGEPATQGFYNSTWGAYGQLITVIPELNMVVVHKSDLGVPKFPFRLGPNFLIRWLFSTTPAESDTILKKIISSKCNTNCELAQTTL